MATVAICAANQRLLLKCGRLELKIMFTLYDYRNALLDVTLCICNACHIYLHPETREQCSMVMDKLEVYNKKFHDICVQADNYGNTEELQRMYKTTIDDFNNFKVQYGL